MSLSSQEARRIDLIGSVSYEKLTNVKIGASNKASHSESYGSKSSYKTSPDGNELYQKLFVRIFFISFKL